MRSLLIYIFVLNNKIARGIFIAMVVSLAVWIFATLDIKVAFPLISFLVVVLLSTASGYLNSGMVLPFKTNKKLETRICRIKELIETCEKEIVIVSGHFDHGVFETEEVLSALENLEKSITQNFYITEDAIDPESKKINEYFRIRNIKVPQLNRNFPHVIIVDGINIRIEIPDGFIPSFHQLFTKQQHGNRELYQRDNGALNKYGLVFYGEPEITSGMLENIRTASQKKEDVIHSTHLAKINSSSAVA